MTADELKAYNQTVRPIGVPVTSVWLDGQDCWTLPWEWHPSREMLAGTKEPTHG